ncbi:MAG: hypothetical protein M3167_06100 [Acidobacteriota bacterium]|nr:hypothetical protein [Acidobacteriota bacterium]
MSDGNRYLGVCLTPEELAQVRELPKDSPAARAIVNGAAKRLGLPELLAAGADYGCTADGELVALERVFPSRWQPPRPS